MESSDPELTALSYRIFCVHYGDILQTTCLKVDNDLSGIGLTSIIIDTACQVVVIDIKFKLCCLVKCRKECWTNIRHAESLDNGLSCSPVCIH